MRGVVRFILRLLLTLALLAVAVFLLFRFRYDKAIRALAETQVKNTTSDIINNAIDSQIENGNIRYDRMIYFEKDLDGKITALKTNMSEVNRLKTDTLVRINSEIMSLDRADISIPIGSLILPEMFSGRGFGIPVHMIAIRNSDATFTSRFTEAGINQTLQQIYMNVQVDVTVLVLGRSSNFTVTSEVIVAETVIVGQVPNTFLQTGGNYGREDPGTG